jgi:hypothetical protein
MAPKPASTSNRGRPKKPEKKNFVTKNTLGDSVIAGIMSQDDTSSEASTDDENDGGVEESKSVETPKKRGRPSTRKPLVSGDGDEVAPKADEVTMLRVRVKQLEDFIVSLGKEVPPMPLIDFKKAEDIVVSEGFDGLENDPVLSEEDDGESSDGEAVDEFSHDGVNYYKDSNNNLYAFGCDMDEAAIVGTWNEEEQCVEKVDAESDSESDDEESDDE